MLPVSALCCVRMRGVESRVQTRNWDLIRCQICPHLGLGFPASRTVRNQCWYSSYPVNGILLRQTKQTKTGVIEQSMYISWVTWTCFHDSACKNSRVRSNDVKPIWKRWNEKFSLEMCVGNFLDKFSVYALKFHRQTSCFGAKCPKLQLPQLVKLPVN